MAELNLALIRQKIALQYEALKIRKRARYKLARQLGFTPLEAQHLSGLSESRIIQLAKELPRAQPHN